MAMMAVHPHTCSGLKAGASLLLPPCRPLLLHRFPFLLAFLGALVPLPVPLGAIARFYRK